MSEPSGKNLAAREAPEMSANGMHRVPDRLVGQRTGVINQIRAFLLERGIAVRQGLRSLRSELPGILATRTDVLSPRMLRIIEGLAGDWRRLDERIEGLSSEIETLARQDKACERLIPPCASCHRLGSGGPVETPILAEQGRAYTVRQLTLYAP